MLIPIRPTPAPALGPNPSPNHFGSRPHESRHENPAKRAGAAESHATTESPIVKPTAAVKSAPTPALDVSGIRSTSKQHRECG